MRFLGNRETGGRAVTGHRGRHEDIDGHDREERGARGKRGLAKVPPAPGGCGCRKPYATRRYSDELRPKHFKDAASLTLTDATVKTHVARPQGATGRRRDPHDQPAPDGRLHRHGQPGQQEAVASSAAARWTCGRVAVP